MKREGSMEMCQCGETSGVRCEGRAEVVVEWMPAALRDSHRAAGNSGTWPVNGARRLHVSATCAAEMEEADPEWASVVPAHEARR